MPSPSFPIRLSAEQRARYEAAAAAAGLSMSTWIKRSCDAAAVPEGVDTEVWSMSGVAVGAASDVVVRDAKTGPPLTFKACKAGPAGRCEHGVTRGGFCKRSGSVVA